MSARDISLAASARAGWASGTRRRRTSNLLDALQRLPAGLDVGGGVRRALGEHVRVSTDKLVDDVARDVVESQGSCVLGGHPRVEHDLEEDVAELLGELGPVAGSDRLDRLVRLLEEVGQQRGMGPRGVPGAAAGRPNRSMTATRSSMRAPGRSTAR